MNEQEKLIALLKMQDVLKVPKVIYEYAVSELRKGERLFWIVVNVFNYGYICGQRAERARRKANKERGRGE